MPSINSSLNELKTELQNMLPKEKSKLPGGKAFIDKLVQFAENQCNVFERKAETAQKKHNEKLILHLKENITCDEIITADNIGVAILTPGELKNLADKGRALAKAHNNPEKKTKLNKEAVILETSAKDLDSTAAKVLTQIKDIFTAIKNLLADLKAPSTNEKVKEHLDAFYKFTEELDPSTASEEAVKELEEMSKTTTGSLKTLINVTNDDTTIESKQHEAFKNLELQLTAFSLQLKNQLRQIKNAKIANRDEAKKQAIQAACQSFRDSIKHLEDDKDNFKDKDYIIGTDEFLKDTYRLSEARATLERAGKEFIQPPGYNDLSKLCHEYDNKINEWLEKLPKAPPSAMEDIDD